MYGLELEPKISSVVLSSVSVFLNTFSPFPSPFFLGQILEEFSLAGIAHRYYIIFCQGLLN